MPAVAHPFRWTHVLTTALMSIGIFALYATIAFALVVQALLESQSEKLHTVISETEKVVIEGRSIIDRLNALDLTHCTDELLGIMRKELFLASRIKDIGFVRNNHVLCTTGGGVLPTPVKQAPWDFVDTDGYKHWSAARLILFNGSVTAPLLEKEQFNVIFGTHWLERRAFENSRWERVFRDSNLNTQAAFGDAGVFRNLNKSSGQVLSPTAIYSEACSDTTPYCVGTETRLPDVIRRNPEAVTFLVLIGLALAAGSGLVAWLVLKKRLTPEFRIRKGLVQNAFYPLYQPIVDLESGKVVGCEVLARFRDSYGDLSPGEFIPVLARANLSWDFTQIIMQKTQETLGPLAGLPDAFKVSINLFPSDIAQSRLQNADSTLNLAASRFHIVLEVTESEELDTSAAKECIDWLSKQGFELAIDDFGTGYSNLSKVRDLGASILKIDQTFIFDIDTGGLGAALVPLMIQIANELGMRVVAEGVETTAQASVVRSMGITRAQGWAFGKPMPAKALEELVRIPCSSELIDPSATADTD